MSTPNNTTELSPVHLVVIIHGLWGTPDHVEYLANRLTLTSFPPSDVFLDVFSPGSMQWTKTYDGIDFCAERVAEAIDERLGDLRSKGNKVIQFSCVGYSMGGLVARFLLGLLDSRKPSFFQHITPMNFATFASPWIGMPNYGGLIGSTFHFFASRSLSRTGNQLYLVDQYHRYPNSPPESHQYPLIALLAHPETSFYKALSKFKKIDIYANAINDRTVPFVTGAAERFDGFQMAKLKASQFLKQHPQIRSTDLKEVDVLRLAGMEIALEPDHPALIKTCHLDHEALPLPSLLESLDSNPTSFRERYLPRLPFFFRPSSYPFKKPFNVAAAVVSPILVPMFFVYMMSSFLYQSNKSRKRIKLLSTGDLKDHEQRIARVGLFQEAKQEIMEDLAGLGFPSHFNGLHTELNRKTESNQENTLSVQSHPHHPTCPETDGLSSENRTSYRVEINETESNEGTLLLKKWRKESGLSELQLEMLEGINKLPRLKKHFTFFDGIPNSHGSIIYRADGLSDTRGKLVVQHWADRFLV